MNHKVELMSLNLYVDNFFETIDFFIERAFQVVELAEGANIRTAKMKISKDGEFSVTIISGDVDDYAGRVTLYVKETFSDRIKRESEIDLNTRELLNYNFVNMGTEDLRELRKRDLVGMDETNG